MFTGLVQNLGTIIEIQKHSSGLGMWIHSTLSAECFKKGASIAVDGVCLTVEEYDDSKQQFLVTAVVETLSKTTIKDFEFGRRVNLETALTLNTPLGGQLVSGHVDGVGIVLESGADFELEIPEELLKFCAVKGSLVVNGVSLTIANQLARTVRIALIPETLSVTNLGLLEKGAQVNLEVDLIARYLERLLASRL